MPKSINTRIVMIISILFIIMSLLFSVLFFFFKNKKNENVEITSNIIEKDSDFSIFCSSKVNFIKELVNLYKEANSLSSDSTSVIEFIEGSDDSQDLNDHMDSKNPPDIFSITTFEELKKQKDKGNVFDFMNINDPVLQKTVNNIPQNLRLGIKEINNCGIPIFVEGFGMIINTKVFSSIFGENAYRSVINSLIKCDFYEFEDFVNKIKNLINGDIDQSVKLNNIKYNFVSNFNTELTNLMCVFSLSMKTDFMRILNNALSFNFKKPSELNNANSLDSCYETFKGFFSLLDLISKNTMTERSLSFTDEEINSDSQAIKQFVNGQSLFLIGDDSFFREIEIMNPLVSKHVIYIPFKIPNNGINLSFFSEENSSSENIENKIKNCISITCPVYLVINPNSKKLDKVFEFISWLKNSISVKSYFAEKLGLISYDTENQNLIKNNLSLSTLSFLKNDDYLPAVYLGAPNEWKNSVIKKIKENLSIKSWTEETYHNLAKFCQQEFVSLIQ